MAGKVTTSQKIAPKDVHALWLILRKSDRFEKNNIVELSKEFSCKPKDIESALKVGERLGLFLSEKSVWMATADAKQFARLDHWRLWKPKGDVLSKIKTHGLTHLFFQTPYHQRPAVIDLFAGVGGLSLGFEAAGFDVVLAIDNDTEACDAHRKNFPWTLVREEGVEKIAADPKGYMEKIPELKSRRIAGIIGGPPCQGFSNIGERVSSDHRNLLTSRFMDTVLKLEPDFFVMENVPGLISSGIRPEFSVFIQRLAKSIGEPATIIVDSLPKIPNSIAKRDKQFRKRLVSGIVTSFKSDLSAFKKFDLEKISIGMSKEFLRLERSFIDGLNEVYSLSNDISITKLIREMENEIAVIAFTSVMEMLLKDGLVSESSCEDVLKEIAGNKNADAKVKKAIKVTCAQYDSSPQEKIMFGRKVGPILQNLIERASKKYNIIDPTILNAANFGTPQSRQRLFLVGVHKNLDVDMVLPLKTHDWKNRSEVERLVSSPTVYDAIHDLPDVDKYQTLIKGHEISTADMKDNPGAYAEYMRLESIDIKDKSFPRPTWNPFLLDCCNRTLHADHVVERLKNAKPGDQDETSHKTRLHPQKPSCTLRAGTREAKGSHTAVRPVHYEHHRVISVREGARIMGYPDWMTFHHTKWHGFRLVGNGVPFQLAHSVGAQIFDKLYRDDKRQRDITSSRAA